MHHKKLTIFFPVGLWNSGNRAAVKTGHGLCD
jgi:hypothetical protein